MGGEDLRAVLPLGHGALWAWQARPWVMGILNVTPDSFSDGGTYLEVRPWPTTATSCGPVHMGILDVTPDSFSDGIAYLAVRAWHSQSTPCRRTCD